MILSVSRRTDIPAFYSDWFINKLRSGSVCVRNPFNKNLVSKIPLSPDNVDCIVFWTKDPLPLMKYLKEIDDMGYRYYFQFTITPYKKDIERNLRDKKEIIETFKELSLKIGKERTILRYDPILITDKYTEEYHYIAFDRLCSQLCNYTKKIIFSFYDDYRKSSTNLKNEHIIELSQSDMQRIGKKFAEIAVSYGLQLETCAEKIDLHQYSIKHASCIDGKGIEEIFNIKLDNSDTKDGNRELCGCMKSIDIGEYDTCIHDCLYCYANVNKNVALNNYSDNIVSSQLMFGDISSKDTVKERKTADTKSNLESQMNLFD